MTKRMTSTTRCVQAHSDGRREIMLTASPWRLALAATLISVGSAAGVVALFASGAGPGWLAPVALAVLLVGVAWAVWPPARVVIDPAARRVRLGRGGLLGGGVRGLGFDEVRGVVIFTALRDDTEPGAPSAAGTSAQPAARVTCDERRAARSVYLLTGSTPGKRSRLRREIARWGACNETSQQRAVKLEAEAAAVRRDDNDAALATLLLQSDERRVAHGLSSPGAWTLARQLAFALGVPLIHHAGHLALLEPTELKKPLAERLREADAQRALPAPPHSSTPAGLHLTAQGRVLQAEWNAPRMAQPRTAAWLLAGGGMIAWLSLLALGLADGALVEAWELVTAAAVGVSLLIVAATATAASPPVTNTPSPEAQQGTGRWRTRWGLAFDAATVSVWRGTPDHEVARFPSEAVTDFFVVERQGRGLAIATAQDHVLLPMKREHAHSLKRILRHHLATLVAEERASTQAVAVQVGS